MSREILEEDMDEPFLQRDFLLLLPFKVHLNLEDGLLSSKTMTISSPQCARERGKAARQREGEGISIHERVYLDESAEVLLSMI